MTVRLHAQAMVLATILAAPGPAEAQFKVCNQTKVLVNFAVGRLGARLLKRLQRYNVSDNRSVSGREQFSRP